MNVFSTKVVTRLISISHFCSVLSIATNSTSGTTNTTLISFVAVSAGKVAVGDSFLRVFSFCFFSSVSGLELMPNAPA